MCVYRVMDACRNFGEHEKCVRVAGGAAKSNSSFLSALQTSQVHPWLDICTAKSMSKFFYNRVTTRICTKKLFIVIECEILTKHQKKVKKRPYWLVNTTFYTLVWARTFGPVNRLLNEKLLLIVAHYRTYIGQEHVLCYKKIFNGL